MGEPPNAAARTADFEFAALQEAANYRRALIHDFSEYLHGRVLEVGAGIGQMTSELLQKPDITGLFSIEPDARFFLRLTARHPGHKMLQGTVDDLKDDAAWDAILNINVLEHIEDDRRELKSYHRLLAASHGRLCLFVPARPEIYAPIDRDFGHFRRYTRQELKQKLEQAGFQILKLHYFNIMGYFAWWFNFRVLKKRGFEVGSVRLFDRIIFPMAHSVESNLCAPPFGQSLLAVAQA